MRGSRQLPLYFFLNQITLHARYTDTCTSLIICSLHAIFTIVRKSCLFILNAHHGHFSDILINLCGYRYEPNTIDLSDHSELE